MTGRSARCQLPDQFTGLPLVLARPRAGGRPGDGCSCRARPVPGYMRGGPCSSRRRIGSARSSHRAARRIAALLGQTPPTHTGTRGRCTGTGRKTTSSIVVAPVGHRLTGPEQVKSVQPSSRRSASTRVSVVSPKLPYSPATGSPSPAPRIMRPPVRRSKVVTSLASLDGRRRATGVIAVPSRIRLVAKAAAVSRIHGSAISQRRSFSPTTRPSR